ncbi:MAG: hypothetical protein DHS20C11_02280 [Lysobacteraceae bacterium]|nr:MAG: hypothetical protein DHS20C11_02280 [Xanthomonadaceae bacterium]
MTDAKFQVPAGLYASTRFFGATAGLWRRLGNLESAVLRDDIEATPIDRPLYVTGLARSGTTIVTEMLSQHPLTTSHRYCDFPPVYTPYWRNYLRDRAQVATPKPVERAHKDRIMVTNDSPEAVEEVLWMQFFDHLHDPSVTNALVPDQRNAAFDDFYRDHIRKLLLVRKARRYLTKGNYNISRIRYILDLFPDARFVIPVRKPVNHIASLAKQHRFFCEGQTVNPKMRTQLGASGHFEFGLDRTAIHFGDDQVATKIKQAWEQGQEALGWGLYWSSVYRYVLELVESDPAIKNACLIVRYEDLCAHPADEIDRIIAHCDLPADQFTDVRQHYVDTLSEPDYYKPAFDENELKILADTTETVAKQLGYR